MEAENLILKYIRKSEGPRIDYTILQKNIVGEITISDENFIKLEQLR